eukprot:TRINITY_DN5547_c1_g1_i4.p1 TRINITY_DN5547_c1_g1~~TRINITY_DN5547_c1_g1_i4.p1  ORF type:complete len:1173 (-),score=234.29 TRINITY_DN5547_c1_g1_i4:17-3535(-)
MIPQPKPDFIIGNVRDVDPEFPIESLMRLADTYGPIFRLTFPGGARPIFVSSQEIVTEICDDTRFEKAISRPLKNIRDLAGDGLFTAYQNEPNWAIAHRILVPAFGPMSIRDMFPKMVDIADQLMRKWEYFGGESIVDLVDNMTRLTLDTIAFCSFDYRFNSFYQKEMHPFVGAMVGTLVEAGDRGRRPKIANNLMLKTKMKYNRDISFMHKMADDIIANRQAHPSPPSRTPDLLDRMLAGRDPVTGQGLSVENIRYQLVTFLIAGHETTSGMLSFAVYELLKNPHILAKAQEEVDRVLGSAAGKEGSPSIQYEQLRELKYLDMILKETLRLWPTAPAFAMHALQDDVIGPGGKYAVSKDDIMLILLPQLHRDPKAWGPDVEVFNPDRFTPENFAKLPKDCYKPFGNGVRACIGRPFAWQESLIVLAMVLQKFDLREVNPSYTMKLKSTLTIKPDGFFVYATSRDRSKINTSQNLSIPNMSMSNGTIAGTAAPSTSSSSSSSSSTTSSSTTFVPSSSSLARSQHVPDGRGVLVLYGSNSGACEGFAQRIASHATKKGYKATLSTLDNNVGNLPVHVPVIIVTSSYEGKAPDNARAFVSWLEGVSVTQRDSLKGVAYTILGCGHTDWVRTYQAVPKLIDAKLSEAGATSFLGRGEANSNGDFFGDFDEWFAQLWPSISKFYNIEAIPSPNMSPRSSSSSSSPQLTVDIIQNSRSSLLRQGDMSAGSVICNNVLTSSSPSSSFSSPSSSSSLSPLSPTSTVTSATSLSPNDDIEVKRHIELALPEGMTYRAGDYLAILPVNPRSSVSRALSRFGMNNDTQIVVSGNSDVLSYPSNYPINAAEFFSNYVELAQVVTRKQLRDLAAHVANNNNTRDGTTYKTLMELSEDAHIYDQNVLQKRLSVLDILESFPRLSSSVTLGEFISMLPPMRIRQYSISSSPLWHPHHVTLSVSVVDSPAWSGHGLFKGVASNFLSGLLPQDQLSVAVRRSPTAFHLPTDPSTPIIMVCAGSGIAPFRGFIQERASQVASGRELGRALLFFGCRHPDTDYIYKDELARWERLGAVTIYTAFSRFVPSSSTSSHDNNNSNNNNNNNDPITPIKYVHHRLWQERATVLDLLMQQDDARIYVCGSGTRMAPEVRRTFVNIYKEAKGVNDEDAETWIANMEHNRYATDVFG